MQQNYINNAILLTLAGVVIGVAGIVAYYQELRWLFIVSVILCIAQLVLTHFYEPLKDEMFPYLAVCLVVGYYLTDNIPDASCFGICLYYATAFIFSIVLSIIPMQFVMIVVPIVGIVAYFLNAEQIFLTIAAFCFVHFLIKHFRGKNPHFAMDVFLWCMAFGVSLLVSKDTDVYMSVKMLKGMLWGSVVYYIVVALYAFYCVRFKKGERQSYQDNA
jgi:hypothetical protein